MAERRGVKAGIDRHRPRASASGKSQEQNLELLATWTQLIALFPDYPLLIGNSRKNPSSCRILADESRHTRRPAEARLHGTMATITTAILHGAHHLPRPSTSKPQPNKSESRIQSVKICGLV
jgi:dihydropteroate synthase